MINCFLVHSKLLSITWASLNVLITKNKYINIDNNLNKLYYFLQFISTYVFAFFWQYWLTNAHICIYIIVMYRQIHFFIILEFEYWDWDQHRNFHHIPKFLWTLMICNDNRVSGSYTVVFVFEYKVGSNNVGKKHW